MLQPLPEIEGRLREFAAMGIEGHIMQILDPAEISLPYDGRVRFEGLEGEGNMLIGRVEGIRADYAAAMRDHRDGLGDLARSVGWSCASHLTNTAPQTALLALHAVLVRDRG